jgi:CBS domain-containing protein
MLCRQLMRTDCPVCEADENLAEVAQRWRPHDEYAIVLDGKRPVGVVSRNAERTRGAIAAASVREIMVPTLLCGEKDSVRHLGAEMLRDNVSAAVVARGTEIVGLVRLSDVVGVLLRQRDGLHPKNHIKHREP